MHCDSEFSPKINVITPKSSGLRSVKKLKIRGRRILEDSLRSGVSVSLQGKG